MCISFLAIAKEGWAWTCEEHRTKTKVNGIRYSSMDSCEKYGSNPHNLKKHKDGPDLAQCRFVNN